MTAGRPPVPILMYHALSSALTRSFRQWTLPAQRFEAHLDYLAGQGYRPFTVAGLVGGPGPVAAEQRSIVLTFDDAFADFHTVALPLLQRYRLPATLYVPTAHVGGTSGWMCAEGEGGRRILSWSQLREIAACGVEIGAHSHTHPSLDPLPPGDLVREVRICKDLLEDRLGQLVSTFAYPYGHYNRRVRDAVGAAGYDAACTMNSYAATAREHPLELPRLPVFHHTDVASLGRRLASSRRPVRRTLELGRRAVTRPAWRRAGDPGETTGWRSGR
jgi:peptidoglycan/xylan/chitin deacetylase (PgdA/CDA1 family)